MTDLLKKYIKQPKTIDEQVNMLISRGLVVDNKDELKYYLENISYYHLSIYFKYFQKNDKFYKGINFSDVLRVYKFDNKLRFLLLELLERVEKSFKCRLAYELSIESDSAHWYLDENFFISTEKHKEIIKIISCEVAKSSEISITHYKNTYNNPSLPPIWNVVEILSFGQCVKLCKSLKREYKNKIARTYDEDEKFILSWLHCLSLLRNNCAHHSRLWNKIFNLTPNKRHNKYKSYFFPESNNLLFEYLIILQIMVGKINPTSSWLDKLKENLDEFKINIKKMGFPDDWEDKFLEILKL
jgi:abortive infection bacteriophage resistance protein